MPEFKGLGVLNSGLLGLECRLLSYLFTCFTMWSFALKFLPQYTHDLRLSERTLVVVW
jgi:hypothetical protein